MSMLRGNIFKNNPCIIQILAYDGGRINKPKKLRGIFKARFNTFFILISLINPSKVINFADYQQAVDEERTHPDRRLIIRRYPLDSPR